MVKKLLLIATVLAPTIVLADNKSLISAECLSKTLQVGEAVDGQTRFDPTEYLVENIHHSDTLAEYNVCTDADGVLTSIQLTYIDQVTYEVTGLKSEVPRVGPRLSNCKTEEVQSVTPIKIIRLFQSGEQITGIALGFNAGLAVQKIGRAQAKWEDFELTTNQKFMGFYGAAADDKIVQMGLMVQDTACTSNQLKQAELERRRQENAEYMGTGEDDDYSELIIVAFVTLVIFSVIIFLTYTCIVRMRNAKMARVMAIELQRRALNAKEKDQNSKFTNDDAESGANELATERPLYSSRGNSSHLR